jgi:dihydroorotase (multifunctional complex type)
MPDDRLLVRGGTVVGPDGRRRADVLIVGGRIAAVGEGLEVDCGQVMDGAGLHLLPGVIDAHSHQWEEGFASRPDFRDNTASAAAGGIATIIDHPLTPPEVLDAARFRDKVELGERSSIVDFALHGGASPDRLDDLEGQWQAGATGLKVFTCETGVPMRGFTKPEQRLAVMERIAALDATALVHAEEQTTLDTNRSRLAESENPTGSVFAAWHSADAELGVAEEMISLAESLGARTYLVHTSLPAIVDAAAAARRRGTSVWTETCPHYLRFTDRDLADRGMWLATAPPVRDETARTGLVARLDGDISVVGSDHCAVRRASKEASTAFDGLPGVPGNETLVALMLDLAAAGSITLERLSVLLAANPALLFGLRHRKGAIEVGLDGDLTIVDLAGATVPRASSMVGSAGWTPYEGVELRGRVVATVVRGTVVARDGRPLVDGGFGRFVARGPVGVPIEPGAAGAAA